jgi:drug/metabolite transporter (DMT)-like permease
MQWLVFVPQIAAFVVSGTVGTAALKWGDGMVIAGSADGGAPHPFVHPFCQCFVMMACQFLCLAVFKLRVARRERRGEPVVGGKHKALPVNPVVYMVPAMLDTAASALLYTGLSMTTASMFLMLRGSVVVFTAIIARVALRIRFQHYQVLGIAITVGGLLCAGMVNVAAGGGDEAQARAMLGAALIVVSQVIVGAQNVIEEFVMRTYAPAPDELVGWEGLFGTAATAAVLLAFQLMARPTDDAVDWLAQLGNSWPAAVSVLLQVPAVPVYNAAGAFITKRLSSTSRMVFDALRVLTVWAVGLTLFGERFHWLQLVAFAVMMFGVGVYKHVVRLPCGALRHDHALNVGHPFGSPNAENPPLGPDGLPWESTAELLAVTTPEAHPSAAGTPEAKGYGTA